MKKLALFVALVMIAASPAMAAQKKARKQAQPEMTEAEKVNDASWRLARDSLPVWLPSWAQPIYHGMNTNQQPAADAKPAKKKKSRSAKARQS